MDKIIENIIKDLWLDRKYYKWIINNPYEAQRPDHNYYDWYILQENIEEEFIKFLKDYNIESNDSKDGTG